MTALLFCSGEGAVRRNEAELDRVWVEAITVIEAPVERMLLRALGDEKVDPLTICWCWDNGARVNLADHHNAHAATAWSEGLRLERLAFAGVMPKKSFGVTSPAVFSEMTRINSGEGMRPAMKRVTVGCSQPINSANSR